jgi:nucleoside-diphosphate-sugar epimerase
MRVLVTGHNGYIGSVMLPALAAAGHSLVGLDTFFYENCSFIPDTVTIPALRMDVRNAKPADLVGFDAVIHLASIEGGLAAGPNVDAIEQLNYRGAVHLAECARQAGVPRFLYASTSCVYGGDPGPFTEDAPLRPQTAAATAKARAEDAIGRLANVNFSPVILRNATVYGSSPRLRADLLLNHLVCWAHTTGRVRPSAHAGLWRPLVHVEDVAAAFAAALVAPRSAVHGQIFNVGSDSENYQLSELSEIVLAAVPGSILELESLPTHSQHSYRVSFAKLPRSLPDFRPRWNAAFGAKDLYAALQDAGVTHERIQAQYMRAATTQPASLLEHLDHTTLRHPTRGDA